MCNSGDSSPFVLKNVNDNFRERQKNVFDQLNSLKSDLHKNVSEDMEVDNVPVVQMSKRSITKQYRGKESIFKRPDNPIRKNHNYMRNIPDFKKNPHKWKKYSLADVKEEDMSDRSNTKTALAFLNELKTRNQEKITEDDDEPKRIVFRKKSAVVEDVNLKDDTKNKSSFRSSKLIMPEYEVGQKVVKEKKNKNVNNESRSQLKLDHLQDYDDDDDDDE